MCNFNDIFSLRGRTALVTGGSRGIGRMIASGLLQQGAEVILSSRKSADCETAAAELSPLGTCHSLPADISTVAGAQQLAAQIGQRHAALDIVVHNAGAAWSAPFESFPESGWNKVSDLNLKAPFLLTQALHPQLSKAGQRHCAKVIHIASIDGLSVNPWETYSYAATKAGLIHLTKRLALRLISDNIVVSCIAPGAFATDMNRQALPRNTNSKIQKADQRRMALDLPPTYPKT